MITLEEFYTNTKTFSIKIVVSTTGGHDAQSVGKWIKDLLAMKSDVFANRLIQVEAVDVTEQI
jgi:hypothetical protein